MLLFIKPGPLFFQYRAGITLSPLADFTKVESKVFGKRDRNFSCSQIELLVGNGLLTEKALFVLLQPITEIQFRYAIFYRLLVVISQSATK